MQGLDAENKSRNQLSQKIQWMGNIYISHAELNSKVPLDCTESSLRGVSFNLVL